MLGIGVDYSVHFLSRYRWLRSEGAGFQAAIVETLNTSGRAILFNALAVAVGFLVLLMSSFWPVIHIGWLVAANMLFSAILTLVLLPAVLDEAYIDLYLGGFDIRAGKQIYAWGRADGVNPTDNLTAWDFSDVLDIDGERLGLLSARVDYYLGDWTLKGVFAPSFTASVLPGNNSRWWPEMPARIPNPAFPQGGKPTLAASYDYLPPALPDEGFRAAQYAAKLSGSARGWDFSVSWFDGFEDLPSVHAGTRVDSTLTGAEIGLEPAYHRRRAVGADFATTVCAIGVRGEAAYFLTADWEGVDPAIDDPYLQYVVGVDYTLRDALPGKDLFMLLQWAQEVQAPSRNTEYRATDLNHLFRKSLLGKADLHLGEFTRLTFEGAFNFATEDWWVRPGFEWSVADGVKMFADIDLLGGPEGSFFGGFRDNRRLQVRLKYSF